MNKNKAAVICALLALTAMIACLFASCTKYETLADLVNSDELKKEMEGNTVEGLDISFEAETDDTVKIIYTLQSAIADEQLETAKTLYQSMLEGAKIKTSLKQAYEPIKQVFPDKDIKMHVVFKDVNGTVIAERTYTSADFG